VKKEIEKGDSRKLGFGTLVAIVFGMMVGSGLYNIPQNLASGAGPGAVALSWVITAAGMLLGTVMDDYGSLYVAARYYLQDPFRPSSRS